MPDFQCAVASAQRDEPIFATASQVRRWMLVEVRGSWGPDAVANTDLGRHVDDDWRGRMSAERIRVVAIRRDLDRVAQPNRVFYAESTTSGCAIWRRDVAGLHAVARATASLPTRASTAPGWSEHLEPVVLVCTNGRHDSCCATFGRPLVRVLRSSRRAEMVWECSHIGGDRFAGNIVVLPDGLYFGRCTPEAGGSVVDEYLRGHLDLAHYRGRSALSYMHQAAEYFTRRELGLTALDAVASVRRVGEPADGRFVVTLADSPTVAVTVRRSIEPAASPLTCTGPADVTLPRYELVAFDPLQRRQRQ